MTTLMTPWGVSQNCHKITEGVYEVDTAGHGGILVGKNVATHLLSKAAIQRGWGWNQWIAYEEDCDWALFAYEQPEIYTVARNPRMITPTTAERMKQIARECLERWHPTYLAEVDNAPKQPALFSRSGSNDKENNHAK